jgi:small subunit ribosomal protein S17
MENKTGIDVPIPKKECEDINCPFHGNLKIRGKTFTGKVIAAKMIKTATVEWTRQHYVPKYERYEKRRSRAKAHNPLCIRAEQGDMVQLFECKPLSKTKRFVIVKKVE